MKINRLFEITTILLNRGTITAKELAQRFEVSIRTIYRDISILSTSGVPIYTIQGPNGGIHLIEDYYLNRTQLSNKEVESILFSLKTLQATKFPEIDLILEKIGSIYKKNAADWIEIDFTSWGGNPNQDAKIKEIKNAILSCQVIEFHYLSASNKKTLRRIEPLKLIFKGPSWYLKGWDISSNDYRTFRISRMKTVHPLNMTFDRNKQRVPIAKPADIHESLMVHLRLKFTKEALYRLYDDYEEEMIKDNEDGTYTLEIDYPEDEWVYGYILSFGPYIEVLSPSHIKEIIIQKLKENMKQYN